MDVNNGKRPRQEDIPGPSRRGGRPDRDNAPIPFRGLPRSPLNRPALQLPAESQPTGWRKLSQRPSVMLNRQINAGLRRARQDRPPAASTAGGGAGAELQCYDDVLSTMTNLYIGLGTSKGMRMTLHRMVMPQTDKAAAHDALMRAIAEKLGVGKDVLASELEITIVGHKGNPNRPRAALLRSKSGNPAVLIDIADKFTTMVYTTAARGPNAPTAEGRPYVIPEAVFDIMHDDPKLNLLDFIIKGDNLPPLDVPAAYELLTTIISKWPCILEGLLSANKINKAQAGVEFDPASITFGTSDKVVMGTLDNRYLHDITDAGGARIRVIIRSFEEKYKTIQAFNDAGITSFEADVGAIFGDTPMPVTVTWEDYLTVTPFAGWSSNILEMGFYSESGYALANGLTPGKPIGNCPVSVTIRNLMIDAVLAATPGVTLSDNANSTDNMCQKVVMVHGRRKLLSKVYWDVETAKNLEQITTIIYPAAMPPRARAYLPQKGKRTFQLRGGVDFVVQIPGNVPSALKKETNWTHKAAVAHLSATDAAAVAADADEQLANDDAANLVAGLAATATDAAAAMDAE